MTGHIPPPEVLAEPQRRRCWSPAEKLAMVEATYDPGVTVSLVARRNGIQPNQLFAWRKLAAQGALTATSAQEEVVAASEYRALQDPLHTALINDAFAPRRIKPEKLRNKPREPMALLTEMEVRAAAEVQLQKIQKSAEQALREQASTAADRFDVFLSHARLDAKLVLGVKSILETLGHKVYVDWIDDPQLDRSKVTAATAEALRKRMAQSQSLIYVYTKNATNSRWMPWELGYFDGLRGAVAVLPIVTYAGQAAYKGEEYLALYPFADVATSNLGRSTLFINRDEQKHTAFGAWQAAPASMRPTA